MGAHKNITSTKFPTQRKGKIGVGTPVRVCYHYNTSVSEPGTILRYDAEEPGIVIILTQSGRVLLDTECQYYLDKERDVATPS